MELNLTLIAQACNFFLTYCFLRVILFKPLIELILAEKREEDNIRATVAEYELDVARQEEEKRNRWAECQHVLSRSIPYDIEPGRYRDLVPARVEVGIEKSNLTKTVTQMTADVIKKVEYVH